MIDSALLRAAIVGGLLLAAPGVASAHAVGVEAKLRGDHVAVEAFFDDNTPASNARIRVTGEDGKMIAEGKTDEKGVWSFPTPSPGKYQVVVDAGAGHLAKTSITIAAASVTLTNPPAVATTGPMGSDPEEIVSDGLTRAETTGPRRWMMVGIGLGVIGLFTLALRFISRKRPAPADSEGSR